MRVDLRREQLVSKTREDKDPTLRGGRGDWLVGWLCTMFIECVCWLHCCYSSSWGRSSREIKEGKRDFLQDDDDDDDLFIVR